MCLGVPHYHLKVDEQIEPLTALAQRYLNHHSCPRMMNDFQRRLDFVFDQLKAFGADALIVERLTFCTLMGGETYLLEKEAGKRGCEVVNPARYKNAVMSGWQPRPPASVGQTP